MRGIYNNWPLTFAMSHLQISCVRHCLKFWRLIDRCFCSWSVWGWTWDGSQTTVCSLMRRFLQLCSPMKWGFICYPSQRSLKRQRHQASRRTTLRPMGVAKATGQIGGHILTKAKVEVHMEKERTKAGAQCCPNFCWDVTTQTWTCMEGACVSTTRWRSATMRQTEASAHVDGTFAAEKGVMLLMLKKITIRRRSDMPKAASALWWRLVWAWMNVW